MALDQIAYVSVHCNLRNRRGPAREYRCCDCGGTADNWSYDGKDPDEVMGIHGRFKIRYSLKLEHYVPRCLHCHREHDYIAKYGDLCSVKNCGRKGRRRGWCERHYRQWWVARRREMCN